MITNFRLFENNKPTLSELNDILISEETPESIWKLKNYINDGGDLNTPFTLRNSRNANIVDNRLPMFILTMIGKYIFLENILDYVNLNIQDRRHEPFSHELYSKYKSYKILGNDKTNTFKELFNKIISKVDWYAKDYQGYDLFDIIPMKIKNELIEKYPDKYKEYLLNKDLDKFNI